MKTAMHVYSQGNGVWDVGPHLQYLTYLSNYLISALSSNPFSAAAGSYFLQQKKLINPMYNTCPDRKVNDKLMNIEEYSAAK